MSDLQQFLILATLHLLAYVRHTSTFRLADALPYVVPYANLFLTYGIHLGLTYATERWRTH